MKIAIVCPYPLHKAPSQRFRFEQYLSHWKEGQHTIDAFPFLSETSWSFFYHTGKPIQKVGALLKGFFKRLGLLFKIYQFDLIFIHREASPIGPPVFEWLVAKVFRKKIIFDFDDAIWLPNYSKQHAKFQFLKWYGKVKYIVRWAHKVSVGNQFLATYALQYNENVEVIPTTIDTSFHRFFNTHAHSTKFVIGWTGTHTTMFYLHQITPVLDELSKHHDFIFRVISNVQPDFHIPNLEYVPWKKESEIADLCQFDIGIMPLEDDDWAKGKCGFKALQYMALSIPTVASAVGVNAEIIRSGFNGFLATSRQEWLACLRSLIEDQALRHNMGEMGLATVETFYSVEANKDKYTNLLQ